MELQPQHCRPKDTIGPTYTLSNLYSSEKKNKPPRLMVLHEPLENPKKLGVKIIEGTWVPTRQLKWGQAPKGRRAHTCFLVPVNERQGAVIK